METLINLIGVIFDFIQGHFFYRSVCCIIRPLDHRPARFLAWFLLIIVSSIRMYSGDPVNIFGTLSLFFATVLLLFQGQWFVKLGVVMLFYPIIAAFNFLHNSIGAAVFFFFSDDMGFFNSLFSTLARLLTIIFWYLFHRFMGKHLDRASGVLDRRSWMLLIIICLASLAAVISLLCFTPPSDLAVYPCMLTCLITSFGSIYLASYLADTIRADMERRNLRLQQSCYEELDKNQQQIRRIRHDMNNQLSVLEGLLKKGDTEKALEYFEDLNLHIKSGTRRFCKDSIVNAVLNAKYNAAEESGIDCFFHIDIDRALGIDAVSLCTIFANTLDNAVEACQKIKDPAERRLSLKARCTQNGYFSYELVNSKVNAVRKKKDAFLTDKEDVRSHGLGIASVREVVRKYDGMIDISYTDDEFRVIILIGAK